MFKTSHLQELKRRYREMYASPEEGTDELVDQYKKETPGQGEEIEEHCGVCGEGEGIEEGKPPRKLAQRDIGMECQECGKKFRAKLSTLQYGRTKCPKCKSTDLDFAYGESVEEEVEMEEQQIDEKGTAYPATVDTLRKIVKDKQHQTVMFKSGQAIVCLLYTSDAADE